MTREQYRNLRNAAAECDSAEQFISEMGYPEWLADIYGDDIAKLTADLENIHWVAHATLKDICKAAKLTQNGLARLFEIPRRTAENWFSGVAKCPEYTRLMIIDLLGLVKVERNG